MTAAAAGAGTESSAAAWLVPVTGLDTAAVGRVGGAVGEGDAGEATDPTAGELCADMSIVDIVEAAARPR